MTRKTISVYPSLYPLYRDVLMTLLTLTPGSPESYSTQPYDTWVTTRQIADAHDLTIYQARMLLLKLAEHGLVHVSDGPIKKSLRWYPLHNPGVGHTLCPTR